MFETNGETLTASGEPPSRTSRSVANGTPVGRVLAAAVAGTQIRDSSPEFGSRPDSSSLRQARVRGDQAPSRGSGNERGPLDRMGGEDGAPLQKTHKSHTSRRPFSSRWRRVKASRRMQDENRRSGK